MSDIINKRTAELAELLKAALATLRDQRITFCILRNYEDLPEYTTHDVDILVEASQLARAAELIRSSARRCGWKLAAEVRSRKSHSLYLYYDDSPAVQCCTFDLVTDLHWGWAPTVDASYVMESKHEFRGMPIASPGSEAATRLMKALLRGLPISRKARTAIQHKAMIAREAFVKTLDGHVDAALAEELVELSMRGDFTSLAELRRRTCRSVLLRFHSRRPVTALLHMLRYAIARLWMLRRGPLGMCVVLLGPDGAGKTALCNALIDGVGTLLFRGSRVYHHNFQILPRLRDVFRPLLQKSSRISDTTDEQSDDAPECHGPLRCLLRLAYYSIDYMLGRLALRYWTGRGKLAIFDRHYLDHYFQRGHRKTPRWLIDIFRVFVPKPDVVLLLEANPRHIHARKPELAVEEIERQLTAARTMTGQDRRADRPRHQRSAG